MQTHRVSKTPDVNLFGVAMIRRAVLLVLYLCSVGAISAHGQQNAVQMSQPITPGHVPIWVTNGVIGDGGPSLAGKLTEVGITNTGTPFCINDAPITGQYHQFCLGADASGSALLSSNPYGGAPPIPLVFNVNGVNYPFPFTTGGALGPGTTTVNELAVWNNTVGTLLRQHAPAQLSDNLTGPLTTSRTSLLATSDGTTPDAIVGTNVNYNTLAGVINVHAGNTLTNSAAVAGYAQDGVPRFGAGGSNVLAFYGNAITTVNNANAWGINTVCTTTTGMTGQPCENEFDLNFRSPSDIGNGVIVTGASTVQPAVAVGYSVGLLNQFASGTAFWTKGLFTQTACCIVGAELGAMAAGNSQNSQALNFDYANSVGPQQYIFQATPGSFNFSGTQTSPTFEFGGEVLIAPTFGLDIANGGTGIQIGGLAAPGANVSGQIVTLNYFDATSTPQAYDIQATPTSLNFSGTMTTPSFAFGGNVGLAAGFSYVINGQVVISDISNAFVAGGGVSITSVALGNGTAPISLKGALSVPSANMTSAAHVSGNACVGYNPATGSLYVSTTTTSC